jgi:hypothetical protein
MQLMFMTPPCAIWFILSASLVLIVCTMYNTMYYLKNVSSILRLRHSLAGQW